MHTIQCWKKATSAARRRRRAGMPAMDPHNKASRCHKLVRCLLNSIGIHRCMYSLHVRAMHAESIAHSGQPVLAQYAPPVDQPPVQSGPGYGPPGGTQYQYGPPQQQQLPQPGAPYAGEQAQGAYRPAPPQSQTSIPYVPSQVPMQSPPQIVVDPHVRSISPGNIAQQQPAYGQPQAGMFQHQTAHQRAQANGYA